MIEDSTILAPAKLNLFLHILGQRVDGYHWLESLVVFLDLADKLTYAPADRFQFSFTGPFSQKLDGGSDNLVIRAAQLLAHHTNSPLQGHLTLEKNIPIAAGLGGGSADAAATLLMLTQEWGLKMSFNDLCYLANQLGADVQACLWRKSVIMYGIGEQIQPYPKEIPPYSVLLVNPLQPLATSKVFKHYDALHQPMLYHECPSPSEFVDLTQTRNDLTSAAIDLCPVLETLLEELKIQKGCHLARMAGSGATCFGLFREKELCYQAYENLKHNYPDYWWQKADFI